LFAEQDPRIFGRDDERLARDLWRLFAADNSKAGFNCSERVLDAGVGQSLSSTSAASETDKTTLSRSIRPG
jgi:hypothetical protein